MISGKSLAGGLLMVISIIIALIGILLMTAGCFATPVNPTAIAAGIFTTVGAITGCGLILRYVFGYRRNH